MRKYLLAALAWAVVTSAALGQTVTPNFNVTSTNGGGGVTAGRTQLTADTSLYVRTPAAPVTFTAGSANIGWPSHGLQVNDAVVLSVLPDMGTFSVTIASPGVFAKTAHGYVAGQPLVFSSTGALPTGLVAGTTYYVIAAGLTANAFEVSATPGGAAVNTSGTQSGVQYASKKGSLPTFSTAGALVAGTPYYVKTVPGANSITLSLTPSGTALGTATLATGTPTYTASTGSDANDGSAADRAHAWLSVDHAFVALNERLDLGGHTATIHLDESAYAEPSTVLQKANGDVYLSGSSVRPSNSVIQVVNGMTFTRLTLQNLNFQLQNDMTAFQAVATSNFGLLGLAGTVLLDANGHTGGWGLWWNNSLGGVTNYDENLFFLGAWDTFVYASAFSAIDYEPATINFLGASASSAGFAVNEQSILFALPGTSWDGSFTGVSYQLVSGSALSSHAFGADIPGSTPGNADASSYMTTESFVTRPAYKGTATNDDALAGYIGEAFRVCVASASGITLGNNTSANVGTLTFTTGGDYDVEANINFAGTAATVTGGQGGINTVSATLPTDGSEVYDGTVTTTLSDTSTVTLPRKRVSLASGAPVYFVAQKSFSAGSVKAFGCITARRVR